jgi:hypothetical protein
MVLAIPVCVYNAEQEIEGEANEKNEVLQQTPVVLVGKYMDLRHLDDSNLEEHLEHIKFIISHIVNERNCDYVLEHTSISLEKIHNMMFLGVGHNLNDGLALLELFKSSTAKKTIANYPGFLESLMNEVCNSTSHDIVVHTIHIVQTLCDLASEITVAIKMVTYPSDFFPKLLKIINAQLHNFKVEIYFQKLLNLVRILSRAVSHIDDKMTISVFASAPRILESLLLDTNISLTTEEQKSMIKALTLIEHAKGNAFTINLTSPDLFEARGEANLILGLHKEALADFEAALNYCRNNKLEQMGYIIR